MSEQSRRLPGPRIAACLFAPVDIASLVVFRIAFGVLVCGEMLRYLANGWVHLLWIEPQFQFKYYGLGWIAALPGPLVNVAWVIAAGGAAFMALGLFYRVSTTVFFTIYSYFLLVDQTRFMNHYYLICLMGLLAACAPCHRAFSIDALRRPALRSAFAPAWALWMLRLQLGIVYFYGGLAKLNADWLLRAEPMQMWLERRAGLPLVGSMIASEPAAWLFSYGGLLFDLLVVPFLLWRKTRLVAFVIAVLFHLTNAWLFNIGVFPWISIAVTTLFFAPDWPRRVLRRPAPTVPPPAALRRSRRRLLLAGLAIYFTVQLTLPLRHLLYPGPTVWTEGGHRFAWRMMLRDKQAKCRFFVEHADADEPIKVFPTEFVTRFQEFKMSPRPDMILQLAHHIGRAMEERGYRDVKVFAKVKVSLNGRPTQYFVDRRVDLYKERRTTGHFDWILPLEDDS